MKNYYLFFTLVNKLFRDPFSYNLASNQGFQIVAILLKSGKTQWLFYGVKEIVQ